MEGSKTGVRVEFVGPKCSGKSVLLKALKCWSLQQGLGIVDMESYWKRYQRYPEFDDSFASLYDVVLTVEPTWVGAGRSIRERFGGEYQEVLLPGKSAQDRGDHYGSLIEPALENGFYVFQEGGLAEDIVRWGVDVLDFQGNQISMQRHPDYVFLTRCSPITAALRIDKETCSNRGTYSIDEIVKEHQAYRMVEEAGIYDNLIVFDTEDSVLNTKMKIIEMWESLVE